MNIKTVSIVAFAALLAPEIALAATTAGNMAVSASVSNTCTISSSEMAFGAYDPITGTAVDTTAALSVTCTQGTAEAITLGQGVTPGAGSTDAAPVRQMASGSNRLGYQLFSDAGRTVVWGNDPTTDVERVAATSAVENVMVYGRITGSQAAVAGAYTDTIVATVTF
ncbi:MAG: spore coat protein U domain-containing protein [Deltaproteobacteria bacterium]|nr:spore coat protein U domain-containing protein [Deltaproteobacteria bacterium]